MPDLPLHPAMIEPEDLLAQCQTRRGRRSGPGGQHRNKVETAIWLKHKPTGVEAHAFERRSQPENTRVALSRLRRALAVEHRRALPRGIDLAEYEPTVLWQSRCRNRRISCNPRHRDFPALLAEALDVLAVCEWDPKRAAALLAISPSQLVRFVKDDAKAFALLNEQRKQRGLHALK